MRSSAPTRCRSMCNFFSSNDCSLREMPSPHIVASYRDSFRLRGHGDIGILVLDVFAGARIPQRPEHRLQLSDEVGAQKMHLPACS